MTPPKHFGNPNELLLANEGTKPQIKKFNEPRMEKSEDIFEEELSSTSGEEAATVVVPPDGGWGWVVVLASFGCNMIVDGIIFSFGMFLVDICQTFNATKPEVALVGSLLSGFYLMSGPFVSALANTYGFRLVTILGSIIGSAAFVLSSFSTSIEYLFFSYGVLGGIGFGLIYVPAVITVGFYFEKWRALATGIAVCGSGIGTFVFAPVSSTLIEKFGWRNALLIQAVLVLTCGIFGALFRPIKPTKVTPNDVQSNSESDEVTKVEKSENNNKQYAIFNRIKFDPELNGSMTSFSSMTSLNSKTVPVKTNYNYPTVKEVLGRSMHCLNTNKTQTSNILQHPAVTMLSKSEKRLSAPIMVENMKLVAETITKKEDGVWEPLIDSENNKKMERRHTMGEKYSLPKVYSPTTLPKNDDVQRPFYRDDIFFGASLQRLPQYTSQASLGYHLSVTRVPTTKIEEEGKMTATKSWRCCPESLHRILTTMLDLSLLKSPSFALLAFSGFFTMMGFYVPFMYLTQRASLNGMEYGSAMWLVSVIGIANTVGRVVCGVVTSFPGCNALVINNIAITIAGISTLFSGLSNSDEYQFFYATIFGLSISCFASLRSILVVDLLGLERLTNAFGLLLLFQGVAATIGAPIAGAFMDITGSYDYSFYLSGSLITLSAIMCYPINWINNWEKRRTENNVSVI
ncbi:monocarboxylate transporter 14-like [Chrysoperla carnea]|uniref:monocarboxylate transporter 14-like n=1 Tax=Chrysoperla carnea TaxID=189513 RepID=UPI001D05E46F|nr:monocarboxylate transporter 14-like [Chrysoperla carnea]XP_044738711.1 monocarboxylate transporter 14-like [Chrysoperla carnea]